MEELVLRIVVFALVGAVSGFLSGLFGIGGGIVRLPIFLHLLPVFGVAHSLVMHVGVGTSIALVLPAAIAATRKQVALGNLDLSFYRTWAVGVLVGALVGSLLFPYASTKILTAIFVIYLVLIGIYEGFIKGHVSVPKALPHGAVKLGAAAAIGCMSALTGTAGGTITTPVLQAFGVRIETAIATASATGIVTGGIGTVAAILAGWNVQGLPAYSLGYVDLVIFAVMLPTTMLAAPLGVRIGQTLNKDWLQRAFVILLFVVAADLVFKLVG